MAIQGISFGDITTADGTSISKSAGGVMSIKDLGVSTGKIAAEAVTDAKSIAQGEGHITILPHNYNAVIQGTWVLAQSASMFYNGALTQAAGAQNDEITFKVFLTKGTYKIKSLHYESTNRGIMNFLINGVLAGTIDTYNAAGGVYDQLKETAAFSVTTSGLKTLSVKMATKHVSSTAYDVTLHALSIFRTA